MERVKIYSDVMPIKKKYWNIYQSSNKAFFTFAYGGTGKFRGCLS
jgi:hypothetical protein